MTTTGAPRSTLPPDDLPPPDLSTRRPTGFPPPGFALPASLRATGTASVVLAWLLSRGLTLALLLTTERDVVSDVTYYGRSLNALFHGGSLLETLPEYPFPLMGILLPPFAIGGSGTIFALLFGASMVGVDAAFTALLWKVSGRQRSDAVRMWLWFVPAIGPMAYYRFDLVPAALAGAAVLAAIRRPALTGVLTALGAALKLWPAVMLPIFLIRRSDRRRVLAGFAATGAVALAVSWVVAGWDRVVSPLHYQAARGLQIESIPAVPLMLARMCAQDGPWHLAISPYKAWEIFGPGVSAVVTLSTPLMGIGLGLLAVLWWRAWRQPAASGETLGWLLFTTALIMTVTNKTLSPQYILWLGGPLCALMARAPGPAVRWAAVQLFTASVLTQIEYPGFYRSLTGDRWTVIPVTVVLAVRNVLLVVLTVYAAKQVWRQTRRSELLHGRVPEHQPLGAR